ncbi:MAG: hypothetical protein J6D57_06200, partial [Mogibacterium sp.]|nr:hypothetical protein [Mogibacterium sp.]
VIAAIFAFCVLDFIVDTSLFVLDLPTVVGQQNQSYTEVSFLAPAFLATACFYVTGSSLYIVFIPSGPRPGAGCSSGSPLALSF